MRRIVIAGLLVLSLAAPVAARAATSSITLNQTDPHLGGPATFTIVVDKARDCVGRLQCARVILDCYQAGVEVASDGPHSLTLARGSGFVLGYGVDETGAIILATAWQANGGPADCVASVLNTQSGVVYATTSFVAAGAP